MTQQSHVWVYIQRKKVLSQEDICTPVFIATFFMSRYWETTWVSVDGWMDKENMVWMYIQWSIIQSLKRRKSCYFWQHQWTENNHYCKWNKTDKEREIPHICLYHIILQLSIYLSEIAINQSIKHMEAKSRK